MKVLKSKDAAYNFIHDNGMQTSVKLSPSGSFDSYNVSNRDSPNLQDKRKYTVIISSSKGCQMACSFCELTKNKKEFTRSSVTEICDNVVEALSYVKVTNPEIKDKYIKLCFQGEGEAILDTEQTSEVIYTLIDILTNDTSYCIGFDGVDISTCMPKVGRKFIDTISELNNDINSLGIKLNPENHENAGRSFVRMFYSMHHYRDSQRNLLIPNTRTLEYSLSCMEDLNSKGVNVVVHYMFFQGINDSISDVNGLIDKVNSDKRFLDFEFRVLRYNGSSEQDKESENIKGIITSLELLLIRVKKLKVQYSSGEEIKAACGMFI